MADDIAFLPASELVALYRTRKLSPVEVIGETLRRLERYEAAVNAFVLYDPQTALAMARASEARWAKGEPQGLLDGVPVALKDTVEALGWPRLLGSRTLAPGTAAREDSPMTARLRAHGAVFFDETTTPEFGWKAVTDSPLCGITRNPWDLQRSPGGSSGGSAVAVLTGLCPLAVGTDAGGSIRIPASFCGLFGLKPTFGRVAMYPGSVFGDFSQGGPLARHVADAALMLDVIKGPDARDWHSLPDDGVRYREAVYADDLKGRRVALSLSLGYHEPAPAVRQAVERAAEVFARLGAIAGPGVRNPGIGGVLGAAQGAEAGGGRADGSGPRRGGAARPPGESGAVFRRNRPPRRVGPVLAPILRALGPAALADHADPGALCRAAAGRRPRARQFPRLDHLHLCLQPDEEPVRLDQLRPGRRAADRIDDHRTAVRRCRRLAGGPRLRAGGGPQLARRGARASPCRHRRARRCRRQGQDLAQNAISAGPFALKPRRCKGFSRKG